MGKDPDCPIWGLNTACVLYAALLSYLKCLSNPLLVLQRRYRAVYDYAAADEDEVSFVDGDMIVDVQPIDEGWMYGRVERTGQQGMLPANYVEAI